MIILSVRLSASLSNVVVYLSCRIKSSDCMHYLSSTSIGT